jgi:4-amino-4-deoxy-L-arabinose transferase-like glycosyltransferase
MLASYKVRWELILLTVVVAVGLAARLHEIGYSLDGDEIFSVELVSNQFPDVISRALRDTPHPPLHYFLLYLWIKMLGPSEISIRALSILFSCGFLLTAYLLLRRFVAAWLALSVLTLMSLSPLLVLYGQQARPYALIAFLSTANLLAFMTVLKMPSKRTRVAIWAASCALLVYAQYLALLVVAFQIVFALFQFRSERLTIFAYGSLGSAVILPWLIAAMGSSISSHTDPLSQISWMRAPTPVSFVTFFISMFGVVPGLRARWLLPLIAVLTVIYGCHLVASRKLPADQLILLMVGVGVPTVVYAVSVWGPKNVFAERQLIGAAIAFLTTIGLCLSTLPRSVAVGFVMILLVWTAAALPKAFTHHRTPPWRDIAAQIDRRYGSADIVAQEEFIRLPLAYYRKAGFVRLSRETKDYKKGDQLLFVCRPFECSDVESRVDGRNYVLLTTWNWGIFDNGESSPIRLYEIKTKMR